MKLGGQWVENEFNVDSSRNGSIIICNTLLCNKSSKSTSKRGEEKMTKIILDIKDCKLEDKEAREVLMKLDTKITTINERTKNHTFQIRELEKKLKELGK